VAALQGDARPLEAEGYADAMAVLDERRVNLAQPRIRAVNQLHALLRALIAGGAPRDLSATTAAALLRTIRPHGAVEQACKAVAKDLVSQIRTLDRQLKAKAQAITRLVAAAGTTLSEIVGVGPIRAGRLISRTGRASRFSTASAFPTMLARPRWRFASAETSRHRLSRHVIDNSTPPFTPFAITQIRMSGSCGNLYYRTRSPRERHRARPRAASLGKYRVCG
jgi:transposase